jgi:hypothetical protein
MMAGYSGTPLATKLGIGHGTKVVALGAPADYAGLVAPLPSGATISSRVSASTDVVHLFALTKADLAARMQRLRNTIRPDAALWVSWPKKSSKVPTDITEDTIRSVALPLGFVDVKVCAVTEVWSGLKLVIRKELRHRDRPGANKVHRGAR